MYFISLHGKKNLCPEVEATDSPETMGNIY
jgi:hypothetical protein